MKLFSILLFSGLLAITPSDPSRVKAKNDPVDQIGDELRNLVEHSEDHKDAAQIDLDHISEEEMNKIKDNYHEMLKEIIKTKLE
jgi:hypothetical protein